MNEQSKRKNNLIFTARMNVIYHENIERYCSLFINWTGVLSIAFSGAVFANLAHEYVLSIGSCLVFVANGAILSFSMLSKLYEHKALKKRWLKFLSNVQLAGESKDNLNKIEKETYLIEKDEPAQNKTMLKYAHKETCRALGLPLPANT